MTDFFDQASEDEGKFRDYSLARQRAKNQPLKFTGCCIYCGEHIDRGRYCSAECREDGESEATIRSRQFR